MTVLRFQSRELCIHCAMPTLTDLPGLAVCAACAQWVYETQMAGYEAEARAAGFPSLDAYTEAMMRQPTP